MSYINSFNLLIFTAYVFYESGMNKKISRFLLIFCIVNFIDDFLINHFFSSNLNFYFKVFISIATFILTKKK